MPARLPSDEGDNQSGSKASGGTDRDDKGSGIFGRLRSKKRGSRGSGTRGGTNWTLEDLVNEMQMLGLEPSGLGRFILSLHKLAVASGVDPSILASIIKDLSLLSEGKQISIGELRKKIEHLASEHKSLTNKISELQETKASLEAEIGEKQKERNSHSESLSKHLEVKQRLEEDGISFGDLSQLGSMIAGAKRAGFDSSAIIGVLSDIDSARQKVKEAEAELEQVLDSKRMAQQRVLTLEQEIEAKQEIIGAADSLAKLGFGAKYLDDLSAAIRMISKTRNIDETAAKDRLVADLQSYYANDQELRSRLRTLESLLREKEDKFNLLDSDFQNEKAVLENASRLISAGMNEKWLSGLKSIIDSYGADIDSLARELQTRDGLKASIEGLVKTKKALEEEERLLRQKVVAAEDQRIKTLTMINDLILHPPTQARPAEKPIDTVSHIAASGRDPEFLKSAQEAIEVIREKLPPNSPARLVLDHALLALRLESKRK